MKRYSLIGTFIAFIVISLITSCGGGSGNGSVGNLTSSGSGGGIGGTGITTGTVSGFGSIYVNGVKYSTTSTTFSVEDNNAVESDLSVGMVVKLSGHINADGITGVADSVEYDSTINAVIASAPVYNTDNSQARFSLLGIPVDIELNKTVLDNVLFTELVAGDLIKVSGLFDANGVLQATYLTKSHYDFIPGVSEIGIKGTVRNYNGADYFDLEVSTGHTVGIILNNATERENLPDNIIVNGLYVEVEGILSAIDATTLTASEIENEGIDAEQSDVSIEGYITEYTSQSNFVVNGLTIDGTSAELSPHNFALTAGLRVQLEGDMNDGVLVAESIEIKVEGDYRIRAVVDNVDADNQEITLMLGDGTVTVKTDNNTRMEDSVDGLQYFSIHDIAVGDFLIINAYQKESTLTATLLKRENVDNTLLRGPIDSFDNASPYIAISGVRFGTTGAAYEIDDVTTSPANFFKDLQPGDIVEIVDKKPADGIADEVELKD